MVNKVLPINGLEARPVPRKPDGSIDFSRMQFCTITSIPRRKRNKKSIRKAG